MPIGLSGSNSSIGGDSTASLMLIELRAQSVLFQQLLGSSQAEDMLGILRNDQAFQLQIPTPLPGAAR